MKCKFFNQPFYISGYKIKRKYRNMTIFTSFFSLLAIETLQNQFFLSFFPLLAKFLDRGEVFPTSLTRIIANTRQS